MAYAGKDLSDEVERSRMGKADEGEGKSIDRNGSMGQIDLFGLFILHARYL